MADRFRPEPAFDHAGAARDGILLVNLGTPAAPTTSAVRRYLAEFLSDPRVVEIPRAFWLPILYGVVLALRPARSARRYAQIWGSEGSPLAVHTARQAALLVGALLGPEAPRVEHAMRYGGPSVGAALGRLRAAGCDRILVVPLYPQYAASTTGSTYDAVGAWLARTRNVPELRLLKHFQDHPAYIAALAAGVKRHWHAHGRGDRLLMSFHGLPRFALERGDPYHCECQATGRLLAQALGLAADQYVVSFQSRFGRAEWLQPYTEPTLIELARQGVGRVDVVCPGFVADCLETLEEIGIGARQAFLANGGREFQLVPCLNESPEWIDALAAICAAHAWAPRAASAPELAHRKQRAKALGAKA
ncbi:MAG: ferrochelatase [Burkholderiales bacterium]